MRAADSPAARPRSLLHQEVAKWGDSDGKESNIIYFKVLVITLIYRKELNIKTTEEETSYLQISQEKIYLDRMTFADFTVDLKHVFTFPWLDMLNH